MLNALAGHPDDRAALTAVREVPPPRAPTSARRPPTRCCSTPTPSRRRVLARIVAGQSLAVHTLPGTGGTQTVINAVGALVRDGKRVLVVSARRSTLDGVRHRLAGIGLPGLAVSPRQLQRDLIRAIGRNEKAEQPKIADIDDALVRLRGVLRDYRGAVTGAASVARRLGARDPSRRSRDLSRPGAGAHDDAPASTLATLERLAPARTEAAAKLAAAARLGEFRFGPDDSPWYGVTFATTEQARAAHGLAAAAAPARCADAARARLRADRADAHASVPDDRRARRVPDAAAGHPRFARPLQPHRVRTAAGRAHPGARPATGRPDDERREPPPAAPPLARVHPPGVHVPDMYEALVRIQQQRTEWQRHVDAGCHARGAARTRRRARRLAARAMPTSPSSTASSAAPAPTGWRRCRSRSSCARSRRSPPSPTSSTTSSSARRCAPSSPRSASSRCSPSCRCATCREDRVAAELEFAWWQSALEHLLRSDRALLGANTAVVDRLERDFRLVDEAHAGGIRPPSGRAARDAVAHRHRRRARRGRRAQARAEARRRDARRGRRGRARRCCARSRRSGSPRRTTCPASPTTPAFDVVIVADAAALCLAEAAPALRRARQVVVFGDPVTQKPTPFRIGAGARPARADRRARRAVRRDQRVRAARRAAARRDAHPQLPRRRRGPRRARQRRVLRRRARVAAVGRLVPRPRQPERRLRRGRHRRPRSGDRRRREPRRRGAPRRHARRRARRQPRLGVAHGRDREREARRAHPRRRRGGLRRHDRTSPTSSRATPPSRSRCSPSRSRSPRAATA